MIDQIQRECDFLAMHADPAVRASAQEIATLSIYLSDALVASEASKSTLSFKIEVLAAEIKRLKTQLKNAQRAKYGTQSEKSGSQGSQASSGSDGLSAEADDEEDATDEGAQAPNQPAAPKTTEGKKKKTYPPILRREEREFEPTPDQFCGCGCELRGLGQEIRERLAYREAEIFVIKEISTRKSVGSAVVLLSTPFPNDPSMGAALTPRSLLRC